MFHVEPRLRLSAAPAAGRHLRNAPRPAALAASRAPHIRPAPAEPPLPQGGVAADPATRAARGHCHVSHSGGAAQPSDPGPRWLARRSHRGQVPAFPYGGRGAVWVAPPARWEAGSGSRPRSDGLPCGRRHLLHGELRPVASSADQPARSTWNIPARGMRGPEADRQLRGRAPRLDEGNTDGSPEAPDPRGVRNAYPSGRRETGRLRRPQLPGALSCARAQPAATAASASRRSGCVPCREHG